MELSTPQSRRCAGCATRGRGDGCGWEHLVPQQQDEQQQWVSSSSSRTKISKSTFNQAR